MARRWTTEEVEILQKYYPDKGKEFCKALLPSDRSNSSILGKVHLLGLHKKNNPYSGYSNQDYLNKLLDLDIYALPLEIYKGYDEPILHECVKGHITKRSPSSVLRNTSCKDCLGLAKRTTKTYIRDLIIKGISYKPLEEYITTEVAIDHICSKNHIWKIAPQYVLQGRKCPKCFPKLGFYSETFFKNNLEAASLPGLLYCVVLVNKSTMERTCVKIGITKGTSNKDVISRVNHFKGYETRIQKIVKGSLEEVYYLEQWLHELWGDFKYTSAWHFGGHLELFQISKLPEILKSIPDTV